MKKQELKRWRKKPVTIKAYQWFIGVESDDIELMEEEKVVEEERRSLYSGRITGS